LINLFGSSNRNACECRQIGLRLARVPAHWATAAAASPFLLAALAAALAPRDDVGMSIICIEDVPGAQRVRIADVPADPVVGPRAGAAR